VPKCVFDMNYEFGSPKNSSTNYSKSINMNNVYSRSSVNKTESLNRHVDHEGTGLTYTENFSTVILTK
jgi:hypothetical protein